MKQLHSVLAKCVLTIAMMLLLFTALAPAAHATCSPKGLVFFSGGFSAYDHIKNGFFLNYGECWEGTAPFLNASCGLSSARAFNFNGYYNMVRYQDIDVPSGSTDTHWELIYDLTANDPNHDSWWTSFTARVENVTDGSTIASQTWWGDDAPLACSRRSLTFQGNYAGRKLRVYFVGRNPSPNVTVIRLISGVTLYQY